MQQANLICGKGGERTLIFERFFADGFALQPAHFPSA